MTTVPPAGRPAPTAARTTSPGSVPLETHGGAIVNIVRSSGAIAELARARFQAEGLAIAAADGPPVVPDWFPLDVNLRVLHDIAEAFGEQAVFQIGRSVPEHARFPPEVRDLDGALVMLDVAFHTNHRVGGVVMYDPATGSMLEGIGHYHFERSTPGVLIGSSTSVYPCSFDAGISSGLAARFEPDASVEHPPDGPCRKRGQASCRYVVSC